MFIPQKPYFPDGPLRNARSYPDANRFRDQELMQALSDALLPHLAARPSPACCSKSRTRCLSTRPPVRWMWQLKKRCTAGSRPLVSIAHRPAVAAFHDTRWAFTKTEGGATAYDLVLSAR